MPRCGELWLCADRCQQLVDEIGFELCARPGQEELRGVRKFERATIGALLGQRAQGIAYAHDPAAGRYVVAGAAVGVPATVPALVVGVNDGGDAVESTSRAKHLGSPSRVAAHDRPLLVAELSVLEQNAVGHADLAE